MGMKKVPKRPERDYLVAELFDVRAKKGHVGVEYEIEFSGAFPDRAPQTWLMKNDGSLRNGIEFISDGPQMVDTLEQHAQILMASVTSRTPYISNRTSTHVHVNVSENKVSGLYMLIMLYFLFENVLVATQPRHRVGNLFCLRAKDAEALPTKFMVEFFENKLRRMPTTFRDIKYSAFNILPLTRFGSVEYRFLGTSLDPRFISGWATLLHHFTQRAMAYDPAVLRKALEEDTDEGFFKIFQDLTMPYTTNILELVPDWLPLVRCNIRYVEALLAIFDQNHTETKTFKLDRSDDLTPDLSLRFDDPGLLRNRGLDGPPGFEAAPRHAPLHPPMLDLDRVPTEDYRIYAIAHGANNAQLNDVVRIAQHAANEGWSRNETQEEIIAYLNGHETVLDFLDDGIVIDDPFNNHDED